MVKPNVVLITTDQQRYDSVGINGSHFVNTPNIDKLGTEGVSFERAYSANAVCTPSRVSIMTGLHLSRHGSYNIGTYLEEDENFLSSILRNNGYQTYHIGKAHWYPTGDPNSPEYRGGRADEYPIKNFAGFEYAELSPGHTTYGITRHYRHWLMRKGYNPNAFVVENEFDSLNYNMLGNWDLPKKVHQGAWLVERAVNFLMNRDINKPFYLNLGFQDPHHPLVLPKNFENRVDEYAIPIPCVHIDETYSFVEHIPLIRNGEICKSRFSGKYQIAGNGQMNDWDEYFSSEKRLRRNNAYYYSMVQLIDEQLGVFLDKIDVLGLRDNTIVVFTSDHGEMLGDHSIGQKGPLSYNGLLHIPLFIRYPFRIKPLQTDECVSLVDIVPTILDLVDVKSKIKLDGMSLKELMISRKAINRIGVRAEYKEEPDKIRYKCFITKKWKLTVYIGESFGELYDLENDPNEINNLFEFKDYNQIKIDLLLGLLEDIEKSEPVMDRPVRS